MKVFFILVLLVSSSLFSCIPTALPPESSLLEGESPSRGESLTGPQVYTRSIDPENFFENESAPTHELEAPEPEETLIYPYDFLIGSLEPSQEDFSVGEEVARNWLKGFLNKNPPKDLMSDFMAIKIKDLEEELILFSIKDWRIASALAIEEDSLSFLVHLRTANISLAAELILISHKEGWIVDDFILDDLNESSREQKTFDPFRYTRFL